jgi:hypothetical protein
VSRISRPSPSFPQEKREALSLPVLGLDAGSAGSEGTGRVRVLVGVPERAGGFVLFRLLLLAR